MEKTKIILLGDNIVSNILKILLHKQKIDYVNLCLPKKNLETRFYAVKPTFYQWFEDNFKLPFSKFYPIKNIDIFFKQEKITLANEHSRPFSLFNMTKSDDIFQTIKHFNLDTAIEVNDIKVKTDINYISLTDQSIQGDLIINTDHRLNESLGVTEKVDNTQEFAVVAFFSSKTSLENKAHQYFYHNQILAILPFDDNKFSIVLSAKNDVIENLLSQSDQNFEKNIQKICGLSSISLLTERQSYPIFQSKVKKNNLSRIILMGDASHRVHPLAGQGLNLGFGDIADFNSLINQSSYHDYGKANFIKKYNIKRAADEMFIHYLTSTIDAMMIKQGDFFQPLMKLPAKVINNSNLIKKLLAEVMI
jgi:2-polyprenyl-6-methoxyphenol hydroxylase-like FAD-dependent oxidoreductase